MRLSLSFSVIVLASAGSGADMMTLSLPPGSALPNPPIIIQKTAGYPLTRAALSLRSCFEALGFTSGPAAGQAFERLEFLASSGVDDPSNIATTDGKRIWLHPSYWEPNVFRMLIENRLVSGLQLWAKYFGIRPGFFSLAHMQALVNLHEFTHTRHLALPDSGSVPASLLNSISVVRVCFPQWVPLAELERLKLKEQDNLERDRRQKEREAEQRRLDKFRLGQ